MTRISLHAMLCLLSVSVLSGCATFQWEENIEHAEQRAKAENKTLFVYYYWWLDPDSNRMYTDVIDQPEVSQLFRNTVNCKIVYEYPPNREYMAKHGVDRYPGFLIQKPDGAYQKRTGYIPKEAFLKWARAALASKPPLSSDETSFQRTPVAP